MKKQLLLFAIASFCYEALIAQPTGTPPANNVNAQSGSAWYRGGNTLTGIAATNNIFGFVGGQNSQIWYQTNGFNRMMMNNGGNAYTNGRIGMGNNLPNNFIPQARLHLLQFGTGTVNADMFRTDGNQSVVNQWQLFTGANANALTQKFRLFVPANSVNSVLEASQANSRITFNTGGAIARMHVTQNALGNQARVGIGELNNPLTYLHIGLDAFPGSGFRPWMNRGVLMYGSPTGAVPTTGTDNMYIGLREVAPDNTESVINWGNNPVQTNIPDRLVFRFTAAQNLGIPASGLLGVETARMISDGTII